MAKRVLFIHGMFMTPRCWADWVKRFEARGYEASAPPWPMHEEAPRPQRVRHPDSQLGALKLDAVLEAMVEAVEACAEPPALVGHSMGGLLVQLLLQRGLGSCGVAIDSAPPKGVVSLKWSFIKSNWPVVSPFVEKKEAFLPSIDQFHYAFANTLSREDAERVWEKLVVPESRLVGRAPTTDVARVDFKKARPPLLFIAGEKDHLIPASLNRSNHAKYAPEAGITEWKEFPGRCHYTLGQDGWEEVADFAAEWIEAR